MPIIAPNNTTGLYGIDTTVQINNAVTGNSLNIQGNATITGNLAVGGILTDNYYYANGTPFDPAGTYSNVDVAAFLASGTLNTNIITTANVSGQYILGNGSQLTGLPATYNDANVTTLLANFGSNTINTTGNITGGNITGTHVGSGAALTSITGANVTGTVANAAFATTAGTATSATTATTAATVTTAAQPNITSVGTLTSLSVSGNVAAAYFSGDGSQLSNINAGNIIGTYGNANVVSLMANFGSNTINTTGNITGGNINTAGAVSALGNITGANITGAHFGSGAGLTSLTGANVTGTVPSATTATTAGTVTTAAQPNITSVGTLTSLSVSGNITGANVISGNVQASGQISAVGNIVGGNLVTGGALVAPSFSATGNITGSNVIATTLFTGPQLITTGPSGNISNVNYITAQYFVGNGSLLTNINAGNIVGAYGNANVSNFLANGFGSNTISTTGNITGGNVNAAAVSASGNIRGGNVNTGAVSATGNVSTGAFFIGDGSQLTNLPAGVGGSNTQVQFNNAGTIAGDSLFTWNTATAVANIGNVSIQGSTINNINPFNASQNPNPFRLTYGNGYNGDYTATADPLGIVRNAQLAVITKQTSATTDTNQGLRGYSGLTYNDLNGQTHTNNLRRAGGSGSTLWLGNGTLAMTANPYLGASGGGASLVTGNIGTVSMGNVTLGHGAGTLSSVIAGAGANIGNAVAHFSQVQTQAATANVITAIGYGLQFQTVSPPPTVPPTTVIGYYMPNNTATYGMSSAAGFRGATNYYFLKNDDDVAQNQLGSLRAYHTYSFVTATSGTVNIDKANGQAQYIAPTGNVTIGAFQNFVTSASDGTNTDFQNDTVTVVVNQGATPYTVTMPTGNSSIRYSGGVSTVSSTANSVSTITITAYNNGSGSVYFVNIATTDAATTPAAGDSISPLMLMGG